MNFSISYLREIYNSLKSSKEGGLKGIVIKGTAGTFTLKIINKALAFISSLILARTLDVSGYGAYSYILAIIALLSIPSVLGMDKLLIRDVARYRATGQWGSIKGLIKWTNSMVIILSLIIIAIAGIVAPLFLKNNSSLSMPAFLIALILIPLNGLIRLRQTTLQGFQRVVIGQIPELLVQPAFFVVLLSALFIFMRYPAGVDLAILLNLFSVLVAFLAGIYLLWKNLLPEVKNAAPVYNKKDWLKSMLPFFLIAVFQIINQRVNVVILGSIKGTYAVGIYSVAERIAELITFILMASDTALGPVIASLYASNERDRLQRIITKIVRVLFLTSLPLALTFILFGKWILLIFGKGFVEGSTALAILSVGQFINVSIGPVGVLLIMTGHENYALRGVALSAIVNVILNLWLIPSLGVNGSAIARAVSLITWNIILTYFVYKKISIRVW